ncbi:MAG: peptidoglycan DD-metalloendopeptidase family protein [Tannerellaceae bacterium]|jgi:septal ring factor EnvC (AmiA/AmiB activator)|nr:peptidoglycan DD-metalloendopeptidase family protein [Tannerellaceae bacterium]
MMKHLLLIIYITITTLCHAQQSAQVRELENQRKTIEKEIETTSELLEQTRESAQRSLARLNLLSAQIEQRKQMITILNREINVTDRDIADTRRDIAVIEKEINSKRERYAASLRLIQKRRNSQDKLLFIFSASSFAQSIRRIHYLRQYAAWQKQQAADIISRQQEIHTKIAVLEKARYEKQQLLFSRENEYKKIEDDETAQKEYVASLNKQQSQLQRELSVKQRRAETLARQIEQQISDEVARERATRNLDNRLSSEKTNEVLRDDQLTETFAANRGSLGSPLNRPYAIVRDYGEQQHPSLPHVRMLNNGIDLQTSAEANACAVFDGVVRAIFIVEPGYSIIVRHGNYLTVYSNLKYVYVQMGDRIKARHPLGKVYTDDDNDRATILHFELWKENEKQNPRPWIGK